MFPDDATLIARGKHATLRADRKAQLERVQRICGTITTASLAALRDCESVPPETVGPMETIEGCLKNLRDARAKLLEIGNQLVALKPIAWPE